MKILSFQRAQQRSTASGKGTETNLSIPRKKEGNSWLRISLKSAITERSWKSLPTQIHYPRRNRYHFSMAAEYLRLWRPSSWGLRGRPHQENGHPLRLTISLASRNKRQWFTAGVWARLSLALLCVAQACSGCYCHRSRDTETPSGSQTPQEANGTGSSSLEECEARGNYSNETQIHHKPWADWFNATKEQPDWKGGEHISVWRLVWEQIWK